MGDPEPEPKALETVPDPGPDLILERRNEKGEKVHQFVLSNVHRQMYTFGSKYPGARDGEEFVFCRQLEDDERLIEGVEATHCTISVDEGGNYWIKKATITAETFVNLEKIEEPRLLNSGDFISLGTPKNCWCKPGPLFHAEFRLPDSKIRDLGSPIPNPEETQVLDESPLDNELVVSKILDYLNFWDLKNARLVCKKWSEEGSKILQKERQICFDFDRDYGKPQNSTAVCRYLHEMERLNIRKIKIKLGPTEQSFFASGEPGEKMLDDLRTLLNSSHNFSRLALHYSSINNESSFSLVHLILEKLGPKLVELELSGSIEFLPKITPPLPQMSHLKKLTTHETSVVLVDSQKWVSLLVPLFRKNLELFTIRVRGMNDTSTLYLEEFLKHEMPKLEGFEIDDDIGEDVLTLLVKLQNHFTYLKFCYAPDDEDDEEGDPLVQKLLCRNSQFLKHLVLDVNNCATINFPAFPKLEKLHFMYSSETMVNWGSDGGLDYKLQLPSLRKLEIDLFHEPFNFDVFNSFFPQGMNSPCQSVTQLSIPVVQDPETSDLKFTVKEWREIEADYKKFQERFTKIKKLFPKVGEIKTEEFYSMDVDDD